MTLVITSCLFKTFPQPQLDGISNYNIKCGD
jgi:hypothetical protein